MEIQQSIAAHQEADLSTVTIEMMSNKTIDSNKQKAALPDLQAETKHLTQAVKANGDGTCELAARPKGARFALLYASILLGSFFMGYDSSCIATLTPVITDEFQALNNLGWYSIAYLLATSATTLIHGQLYTFYSMKKVYITSFAVFIVGTVISATAPTSAAFIVGRALSGLGAAGIFSGVNIIIANTTSLRHRPVYNAFTGGMECLSLAFSPIISGLIAHESSWRVSFYIIIPTGAVIIATVWFTMGSLRRPENAHLNRKEKLIKCDLVGFAISVPMALCLVLALQWAGTAYPWANWRVIILLVLAFVLLLSFLGWEHRQGNRSMVPLAVLGQRSVAFASLITFCNFGALSVMGSFIAIYFQAIKNATPFDSGLMYIPLALSMALSALASGPLTSAMGYNNPVLICGCILMTIGSGLITTFTPETAPAKWISYQIIFGIGVGLSYQPPFTAVQTVLDDANVATALVTLNFAQVFGGVIAQSVAQNVFFNRLAHNLATIPTLESGVVLDHGVLDIIKAIPLQYQDQALSAYNEALRDIFYLVLGVACLALVCTPGIEWKSVKGDEGAQAE